MKILCFDMGGTSVKYGLWENETITQTNSFPTPSSWQEMKELLKNTADQFKGIDGIGFSSPGSVDSKAGVIKGISAIPYIHNFEIVKELEMLFGKRITIENDAKAAALAELYYGKAKNFQNVVFFIIGSGIGGAISINKQIVKGANLFGGEIGYMLLDQDNTVSQLASPVQVAERFGHLTGKELFELSDQGDKNAREAVEGIYDALARSMYNICLLVDPELILIGGGISQREDLIEPIQEKLNNYLKLNGAKDLKITVDKCEFKQDANLIGAAVNFQNTFV